MGVPRSEGGGVRVWHVMLAALAVWALWALSDAALSPRPVPYSDFLQQLEAGRIAEVHVSERAVRWTPAPAEGETAAGPALTAWRIEDPELARELRAKGVKTVAEPPPTPWQLVLPWLVPMAVVLMFFALRGGGAPGVRGGLAAVGRSRPRLYMERDVKVRFGDAAGVPEAKEELKEVLEFLRTPEKFHRLGGKMPRGILLVGPPGTGKTLLARAVAGEAGVPFFSISGSEFVEMFVGVGAARVRDLFEQARAKAPCIIFIDELDALGKVRGMGVASNEEREQTLNQLLVELDGFDPRGGVVLMAATNRPEILDPALLRAGRFDRQVLVDRPDRQGRREILEVHARKVPLRDPEDLDLVAGMTAGMVGADLANIVNEGALQAVRHRRDQVVREDLEEAVERVVAGLARKSRVLSPAEKRRVAWHEVGHAMVTLALGGDEVKKISILPRGISALGYTIQLPTEDRFLMTQGELENRIAGLLGGRAAEDLVFGELSTGAQDDLRKATLIARGMVRAYGMSDALGPISLADEPQPVFLGRGGVSNADTSEQVAMEVDQEVRRILDAQYQRASWALGARLAAVDAAAQLLLERETLSGAELEEILREHPPGEEEAAERAG